MPTYSIKTYIKQTRVSLVPDPEYATPFFIGDASGLGGTLTVDTSRGDVINLEYSLDAINWTSTKPAIPAYGKVYIRANATHWSAFRNGNGFIYSDNEFNAGGNTMSLLYGSNFTGLETSFPNTASGMFSGMFAQTKIVSAEDLLLPALTTNEGSYDHMFANCAYLTKSPLLLPATTIGDFCHEGMFEYSPLMTTTPEIMATEANSKFRYMFNSCTAITFIKVHFTSGNNLDHWVSGVPAGGTFYKPASWNPGTGESGIPSGWTVVDE